MMDGKELTLGVSGMLRKNALVIYDRETETLWASFTGEALAGPMKGKALKVLESSPRITFKAWRKEHPNTKVLTINGVSHVPSHYAGYFADPNEMGFRGIENLDRRLPGKELVIGVVIDKKATAIPLGLLKEKGVVTAKLDGKDIALFVNVDLGLYGAVLLPDGVTISKVDGRTLVGSDGRTWSAIDGKGSSSNLEMLPALRSFWFAWGDHYPESGLITS